VREAKAVKARFRVMKIGMKSTEVADAYPIDIRDRICLPLLSLAMLYVGFEFDTFLDKVCSNQVIL